MSETPLQKLRQFAELPKGWAGGEGEPFDADVLEAAELLGYCLLDWPVPTVSSWDVFPGRNGNIVVTAYLKSGRSIDFEITAESAAPNATEVKS